jgi:4-diphosphocytidyl-2-C-methyl-D-erythritol kinase
MQRAYALPAPAKLNLFLHVLGRRPDGYHELQSVLALIDLADWIDIERRDDGELRRHGDLVGAVEHDLALRAALLLQQTSGTRFGADITVAKRIPAGAGLGGGSSDAATVLLALNRIWDCGLPRERLAALALQLGADVPFFVHGSNAFAEGLGERVTALPLRPAQYALIWPQVHVSTREIFSDPGLTCATKATKMSDFAGFAGPATQRLFGANDLQAVAVRRCPPIAEALAHLVGAGLNTARMTGSGSAVFAPAHGAAAAARAVADLPAGWMGWAVQQLPAHPLLPW